MLLRTTGSSYRPKQYHARNFIARWGYPLHRKTAQIAHDRFREVQHLAGVADRIERRGITVNQSDKRRTNQFIRPR